ncbi:MAG: hypothetical protein ACRENE_32040, partial [Polyangiaceae bacterium]
MGAGALAGSGAAFVVRAGALAGSDAALVMLAGALAGSGAALVVLAGALAGSDAALVMLAGALAGNSDIATQFDSFTRQIVEPSNEGSMNAAGKRGLLGGIE